MSTDWRTTKSGSCTWKISALDLVGVSATQQSPHAVLSPDNWVSPEAPRFDDMEPPWHGPWSFHFRVQCSISNPLSAVLWKVAAPLCQEELQLQQILHAEKRLHRTQGFKGQIVSLGIPNHPHHNKNIFYPKESHTGSLHAEGFRSVQLTAYIISASLASILPPISTDVSAAFKASQEISLSCTKVRHFAQHLGSYSN